ncbi:xanthine dehydrogenase family protein subunit M [Natronolimnobius sp. AArcel1]|uniref:FAD binding domain-containing protein n=1 Tax=Natronolimnobius sp. AArcel1 TaxID=1679093 RepID=UPI0013ED8714|nr:FAD binding domain-containing protein [Natronolimnobius sp. AArcel1]NGM70850.1 xanthine dehydrogenase family protein subunit M [Natronolimnobius sp. AArcel1]
MYPPSFDYHRAGSVTEALSLLAELPDATLLAGGHALLPRLKTGDAAPGAVVDVSTVAELTGLKVVDDALVIGAATTYAAALEAGTTAEDKPGTLEAHAPAVAAATRAVGDRQIRNRGTVGGNLAEAHPDSDLPAAALVADATVRIRGPDGERDVPVGEFLTGAFETVVGDDEIVTSIRIPLLGNSTADETAQSGGAYVKQTHPTSGYAMVGVAARVTIADGVLEEVQLAANGVADTAVRLSSVEDALEGTDTSADLDGCASEAVANAATDVPKARRRGDVHASEEYRSSILPTVSERAIRAAIADAGDDERDENAAGRGGETR